MITFSSTLIATLFGALVIVGAATQSALAYGCALCD